MNCFIQMIKYYAVIHFSENFEHLKTLLTIDAGFAE